MPEVSGRAEAAATPNGDWKCLSRRRRISYVSPRAFRKNSAIFAYLDIISVNAHHFLHVRALVASSILE